MDFSFFPKPKNFARLIVAVSENGSFERNPVEKLGLRPARLAWHNKQLAAILTGRDSGSSADAPAPILVSARLLGHESSLFPFRNI